MALKTQDFELGVDGAAITSGNSGGGTNSPFSVPVIGTGASLTYDAASAKAGTLGMRIFSGSSGATTVHWTDTAAADYSMACWWRFDAAPASAYQGPLVVRSASDTGGVRTQQGVNRTLTLVGTGASSPSPALTPGAWYYLDMYGSGLGGTADHVCAIYNLDGSLFATLILSGDASTQPAGRLRYGNATSVSGFTHRFDNLRGNVGDATPNGFPTAPIAYYIRRSGVWVPFTPLVRRSGAWV